MYQTLETVFPHLSKHVFLTLFSVSDKSTTNNETLSLVRLKFSCRMIINFTRRLTRKKYYINADNVSMSLLNIIIKK